VTTAGFFVLGISAWHLLRNSAHRDFFLRSARMATVYATIGVIGVGLVGHSQAQHMVEVQPMKMAAAEGLFHSEDPAGLSLLTIGDWEQRNEVFSIRIPGALSFLSYNRFDGEVRGIHELQAEYEELYGPGNYIPPVAFSYWSFRAMVGAGMLMVALALFTLYRQLRNLTYPRWLLRALVAAIALPYVANTFGWFLTEVGRQPWIVFGLQRVEDAVSPNVTVGMLAISLVAFVVIYGVLMAADVYLLAKFARRGPEDEAESESPLKGSPGDEPADDIRTAEPVGA
jgi:cytochrome d ubiquinol oxidase subunit I